jgi:hypothetical protein
MNCIYSLIITTAILSSVLYASQAHNKVTLENASSYNIAEPTIIPKKWAGLGPFPHVRIKIFNNRKKIGKAEGIYFPGNKNAYLKLITINQEYRNVGLGSHLFKYTIAHMYKTFDCQRIDFIAQPFISSTQEALNKLVSLYERCGAQIAKEQLNDDGDAPSIIMQYPINRAAALAVLLPIFESKIPKPNRKNIAIDTKLYKIHSNNPLNIIMNYIEAKNAHE